VSSLLDKTILLF